MSKKYPRLRQRIISTIIGILLIAGAFYYSGILKSSKKPPKQKNQVKTTNVIYAPVQLKNSSVSVQSNGTLTAKNKIDIVSRAQGVFRDSDRPFRAGVFFNEGEVLVSIDNDEYLAQLRAARAKMLQSMTGILADLKFDYPEQFDKWYAYINAFDVNRTLKELPVMNNSSEKAFIINKNIVSQYYDIKAQEVQASYYQIRAPYSGILRENLVDKGGMINAGQRLGTFIDPSVYELEVKINPSELKLIKVGKSVRLTNSDNTQKWNGTVTRINKVIDPQSQSALAIVEVSGNDLKEGMFLQTEIKTVNLRDVAEIERNLLIDEKYVYLVADSTLQKQEITVKHVGDKTVFVTGIAKDAMVIQKPVSGAFDGMKVNPINLSEEEL